MHLFGGTWSPAAAMYCLRRGARRQIEEFDEEILRIIQSFYVHDSLKSGEETQEITSILSKVMQALHVYSPLLKKGTFRFLIHHEFTKADNAFDGKSAYPLLCVCSCTIALLQGGLIPYPTQ